jgi:hypothetical protein
MSPLHFISICWLSPPWNSNSAAKLVSATVCSCCTVLSVQLLPIRLHFMRVLNWNCCFFVWLCQTFSFQRRHMHQNIIAKVFWSCTFSPCIIGKKTKKKEAPHDEILHMLPKTSHSSYFIYILAAKKQMTFIFFLLVTHWTCNQAWNIFPLQITPCPVVNKEPNDFFHY